MKSLTLIVTHVDTMTPDVTVTYCSADSFTVSDISGITSGVTCLIIFWFLMQNQAEWNSTLTRSQTNTAVIRGLKPGAIYVFQVRARTVAGFGRFSGKMYFQTMTEGRNKIY